MGYYILCPYYRSEKKLTISCEDSLHIFYNYEDKKKWLKVYCAENWCHCEFAQAMEEIYRLEDDMSDWMKKAKLEERKAKAATVELKNLNREHGKRVAELNDLTRRRNAERKAAEHIMGVKDKQIKKLTEEIEGWKQLHELDQATIACLMHDVGVTEFDGARIRPFRETYEFSFAGKRDGSMIRKLHIKTK